MVVMVVTPLRSVKTENAVKTGRMEKTEKVGTKFVITQPMVVSISPVNLTLNSTTPVLLSSSLSTD